MSDVCCVIDITKKEYWEDAWRFISNETFENIDRILEDEFNGFNSLPSPVNCFHVLFKFTSNNQVAYSTYSLLEHCCRNDISWVQLDKILPKTKASAELFFRELYESFKSGFEQHVLEQELNSVNKQKQVKQI